MIGLLIAYAAVSAVTTTFLLIAICCFMLDGDWKEFRSGVIALPCALLLWPIFWLIATNDGVDSLTWLSNLALPMTRERKLKKRIAAANREKRLISLQLNAEAAEKERDEALERLLSA